MDFSEHNLLRKSVVQDQALSDQHFENYCMLCLILTDLNEQGRKGAI